MRNRNKQRSSERTRKRTLYALCTDSHGINRRVTVQIDGHYFRLTDDRGHSYLADSLRTSSKEDIRKEISTVYKYTVQSFEDPEMKALRKREALGL
jgi:hypothetical protein